MVLRTIFFGSPEFAVPSLCALADDGRFDVVLVVTQPDRTAGRGRRLAEPPVKVAAVAHSLRVWQPDTLKSPQAVVRLRSVEPDLFVVVAYGEIFRREVLQIPACGCLNVHPSLLPKYRGSSPIPAAILNGDQTTGVSVIQMVRKLDAGPIVAQQEIELRGDESGGSLSVALAILSANMLPDACTQWCAGEIQARQQDDAEAMVTRELTKDNGRIDWTRNAIEIERQVRAYSPWPTAWTMLDGRRLVIHAVHVEAGPASTQPVDRPGTVVHDGRRVIVVCGSGNLDLVQVQPEGKRSMDAGDWVRGLRSTTPVRFDFV